MYLLLIISFVFLNLYFFISIDLYFVHIRSSVIMGSILHFDFSPFIIHKSILNLNLCYFGVHEV